MEVWFGVHLRDSLRFVIWHCGASGASRVSSCILEKWYCRVVAGLAANWRRTLWELKKRSAAERDRPARSLVNPSRLPPISMQGLPGRMVGVLGVSRKLPMRVMRWGHAVVERVDRAGGEAQDLWLGLKREILGDAEFGDAVNQRPGGACQFRRVAGGQAGFLLRGFHVSDQDRESALGGRGKFRIAIYGQGPIEHHLQVFGRVQGEADICQAGGVKAAQRGIWAASTGFAERIRQALEALGCDGRQQFVLFAEVAVGRIVGDARAARYFAQRKGRGPHFGDEGDRGIEQHGLQVSVM